MTKIWLKLNCIFVKRLTKTKSKFAVKINTGGKTDKSGLFARQKLRLRLYDWSDCQIVSQTPYKVSIKPYTILAQNNDYYLK